MVTADETFFPKMPNGLNNDLTFASDSISGPVCTTVNEDLNACVPLPYQVGAAFIAPAAQAAGGIVGVNLIDPSGSDHPGSISDQLYLSVAPVAGVPGIFSVSWCWDSDREPGTGGISVICQNSITVPPDRLFSINEVGGFMDLTSFFTASPNNPLGPLAGDGVWQVLARPDIPEPASLAILAISLLGMGAYRRLRN